MTSPATSLRRWVWVLFALLLSPSMSVAQRPTATESEVKAAFVLNFARFTEWPAAITEKNPKFRICVSHYSPLGDAIDRIVVGKNIGGKPIDVIDVSPYDPRLQRCQVLVVDHAHSSQFLLTAKNSPILTIGDGTSFTEQGGHIDFVTDKESVRFEINPEAAERAQLKISSKLLALARIVRSNNTL